LPPLTYGSAVASVSFRGDGKFFGEAVSDEKIWQLSPTDMDATRLGHGSVTTTMSEPEGSTVEDG
jgi:hypothetical protein